MHLELPADCGSNNTSMRSPMKLYARGITNALIESEKTDRRRTKQHAIDPFASFTRGRSIFPLPKDPK